MFRKVKLLGLIIRRLLVLDVDVLPLGNDVGELLPLVGIDGICCFSWACSRSDKGRTEKTEHR
jgi:hypothetical protein